MKIRTVLSRVFLLTLIIPLSINQTKAAPLSVTVSSYTNDLCNGGNNATATATASGGTSPYTYAWSTTPTQVAATATGLSAGTYTVGVVDASFNTATASVTITQPTVFIVVANNFDMILCNGGKGTLNAFISGGVRPYTYVWSPAGGTSDTTLGLSVGCYTLTATDNNGCTASSSACLTQPSLLTVTTSPTADNNNCNGTATATVAGGTAPYTYLWSQGGSSASISNLCAGSYCCTVTDNHGCLDTSCTYVSSNCANNYNQSICIVTLDTATNKCKVIWGRGNSPASGGYGHYNVYRDTNPGYGLIHSQALNVLSEYIDTGSNPSAGPVSYELSTVDSCGESVLSSPHTSIHLTASAGHGYTLNWTAYVGFTPSRYIIFRGPALNKLTVLDSVANNILTYQDTLGPLGSFYAVEAEDSNGVCVPSAHRPDKASISLLSGALSNGFNTAVLGINNVENNITNLKVYPNPSNGMFTLNYSMNGSDNVTISIVNELGQQVYVEQKHAKNGSVSEQLNVENLASGIYTLRIQTSKGISVSKLSIMQK